MNPTHLPKPNLHRIGFHYYPDTQHYRQTDLEIWLPRLVELGASWLTLLAPSERAIPESFIQGLLCAGIQPLLHFCPSPSQAAPLDSIGFLMSHYARWGVRQVAFYDRPNLRESWPASVWAQSHLVERFLDEFVPLALAAQGHGLTVITPPLEPGGDYWDLAFLRTMLRGLQRRGCANMPGALAIGAYAWINDRPLDWGAGGPGGWPGAQPYDTPADQQDQQGFHIFDWYLAICQEELGYRLPVYLLRAGQRLPSGMADEQAQAARFSHARQNLSAAQWMADAADPASMAEGVPEEVRACNFWLLAADEDHPDAGDGWFLPDGGSLPAAEAFCQWAAYMRSPQETPPSNTLPKADEIAPENHCNQDDDGDDQPCDQAVESEATLLEETIEVPDPAGEINEPAGQIAHPISHYVLLPLYAWGAANWDLALVESLLQESRPAIGFSLAEARLAKRVTVVGAEGAVSVEALSMLRQSGCQVERLMEDGTLIAT